MWLVLTISLFYRWRPTYLLLFSHSVVSDSSWPHELQHARLPCPSPSPRVCSDSCPLNQWCHPIISSSVICFSCLQSSLASGSFPTSRLLPSGSQSIGASASVLPMNVQAWFPLGLTGLISLLSYECGSAYEYSRLASPESSLPPCDRIIHPHPLPWECLSVEKVVCLSLPHWLWVWSWGVSQWNACRCTKAGSLMVLVWFPSDLYFCHLLEEGDAQMNCWS